MEVPMKKEVHQAWLALADGGTKPHPTPSAVRLQRHYVLLHLFLWQASASEPQELSESLPNEEEEEEGFDMLQFMLKTHPSLLCSTCLSPGGNGSTSSVST